MSAKPVPVFLGVVTAAGALKLDARELFTHYVKRLAGKPVSLVLKVQTRQKSRSQLGYLFGIVYPVIAEHCGYREYEIDALHDELMRRLRGVKPDPNPLKLRASLAEMPHEEVSAYIEDVRFFALTELGCSTPDANKVAA